MKMFKKVFLALSTLAFLAFVSLAAIEIMQSEKMFAAGTCYNCWLNASNCWECRTIHESGGTSCSCSCLSCSVSGSCNSSPQPK